jgi:hypothetical protein
MTISAKAHRYVPKGYNSETCRLHRLFPERQPQVLESRHVRRIDAMPEVTGDGSEMELIQKRVLEDILRCPSGTFVFRG